MLSLSDQCLLARRSDFTAMDGSMCLSVQAVSSLSNLDHHFRAKIRENESLYAEVVSLKKELRKSKKKVRLLKKETKHMSKMLKIPNRASFWRAVGGGIEIAFFCNS